jgi:hypothetical protein
VEEEEEEAEFNRVRSISFIQANATLYSCFYTFHQDRSF